VWHHDPTTWTEYLEQTIVERTIEAEILGDMIKDANAPIEDS
jgi:hypothetical protein